MLTKGFADNYIKDKCGSGPTIQLKGNPVDSGQEVKAHHQDLEYVNMGTTALKMRIIGFGLDKYHYRELTRFVYSFIFLVSGTSKRQ